MIVLAAVAAATASATTSRWKLVASGQKYALYSTVSIAVTVTKPTALGLRSISAPSQDVHIGWRMSCKTGGGRRTRSGSYVSRAPTLQRLRLPKPHPRSCSVSAHGQLAGGGTLTLKLFAESLG
jgi:hypothetical protein